MELISLFIAFVCFFIAFFANLIVQRKLRLKIFEKYGIPGPKPSFWTGNLSQMRKMTGTKNEVLSAWIKEYGGVFGYFSGGTPYIVIKDLDLLKLIFLRDLHVFHDRPLQPIRYLSEKAVMFVRGERWRSMRHVLTPSFSRAKLKLMTSLTSKQVDHTVSLVANKAENSEMFDIYSVVQCLSLDVIAGGVLSINTDSQSNPQDKFKISVSDFFRLHASRTKMLAVLFPSLTRVMSFVEKHWTASGKAIQVIVSYVQKVIRDRKENPQLTRMDFLQFLMDNGDDGIKSSSKLTHEEIAATATNLVFAGYDTTSTALAYTFYLLIKHPEIQERLYNDIKNTEDDDSYDSIQGLRYLDQVLNESLRLYPPVPGFVTRYCATDHQVCSSLTIPKGVSVEVPVWDIHHDPDLWPDPWTFNPDRFSPDNKASLNRTAHLAFGLGARDCIGRRFALMEAKLAIFKLLKSFRFEMCEKTEDPLTMECYKSLNHPKNGVFLRAVQRKGGITCLEA